MSGLITVPDTINFPSEEEKTLKIWNENKIFEKSLKLASDRPRYTFFDGPPFATGLPHYGHILAGTIKVFSKFLELEPLRKCRNDTGFPFQDVVTRWAHQDGYYVERRFGWDTHGLPVEYEVDKKLGIKGPSDILEMGIGKYNAECRSIVMRYSHEWETMVARMGRWIDFRNDYKTLYPWFMESVWWAFSELFKKGLVYRGVKVMPYSTSCTTPLSNFEAGQNYKDVVDPCVCVGFRLDENQNRMMVAWTTTPWTLPSNLALCVHPDLDYVVVRDPGSGMEYVVLEERLFELKNEHLELIEKVKGRVFEGKAYEPLFPYFSYMKEERGAFRVLCNTFVTTDQGTGVVHQAPYFGEIDYQICLENGVITKDMKIICPVDESGRFTKEVTDFANLYVKDADKQICKNLKERGYLIKQGEVKHSYPFCWRSDTPLLYKAVPSWFIRVEQIIPKLLANNDQTYWVPSFVKEKRFANWLRDARDWAVSRNRFWGTPINLWVSDDLEEIVCPGSIAELESLTGTKITDIHRESVDHLTIPSKTGRGVLKRVTEVFDCWFESGSMPYAQNHYPFENKKIFEDNFPADFIAEGIDQTRGWFYTLLVLSTALFNKPPFKNLICNGLVLAADGNKMSKRKKNYPDPMEVVQKYGADALRLYLINSPVVRGENLRFREEGVRDLLKDVFLPWFNAYRFFVQNVQLYEHETGSVFSMKDTISENVMDRWIESFTNSLVRFVRKEMSQYRLYAVVTPLTRFFDTLTNCYIRLNRKRIKGDFGANDQTHALSALGRVLIIIVRLMSPFTPYFCEYVWQNLRKVTGATEESVHFTMLPTPDDSLIDESVERRVQAMRDCIDLVRVLRERKGIPVKYPLKEMIVVNRERQFLDDLRSLEHYILSEVNVRKLTVSQDKQKYGITLKASFSESLDKHLCMLFTAEPNFRLLGTRLKGDQKKVVDYLKTQIKESELEDFLETGWFIILVLWKLTVFGHELSSEEVYVSYTSGQGGAKDHGYETHSDGKTIVMLDTSEDSSLVEEGLAREITNRVQKLRKAAKLVSTDPAVVYCVVKPETTQLATVVGSYKEKIEEATGTPMRLELLPSDKSATVSSVSTVKDAEVSLWLVVSDALKDVVTVGCNGKTVRIHLKSGSEKMLSYNDLLYEIRSALDLWEGKFWLMLSDGTRFHPTASVEALSGQAVKLEF
ncbi:isoleucine--tRNA ligase [Necator americanus]|uniref:Isoleucine--tRNA ligase, cytoplasmic n=1 Tax=Necator americanus TaxID=51031 RepID=W2T252_NECAM|nr:isoleucine--tRNA ligase [Necator americanus]ETN76085.1 isoleucine--tRNA ligase [Necator americanus]